MVELSIEMMNSMNQMDMRDRNIAWICRQGKTLDKTTVHQDLDSVLEMVIRGMDTDKDLQVLIKQLLFDENMFN